ncbi:hypothetical protein [Rugamonas apoptosis]|uniref:Uncharacterized protein n=1 Tax=Rugamonas apoptosis TaxID=2758570 RepID=A0A7W2IN47_9BURK|nr:hypothetical protein [Rugamonas apoptosis]MBA5690420.1 hypothetical protein [Rugamonas apoptosis]
MLIKSPPLRDVVASTVARGGTGGGPLPSSNLRNNNKQTDWIGLVAPMNEAGFIGDAIFSSVFENKCK